MVAGVIVMLLSGGATAAHAAGATISTVTFTGSAANPMISIVGSGFGATAPPVAATGGCGGSGGNDYGTALYLTDTSNNPHAFAAGYYTAMPARQSCTGLVINSYSDTQVSYHFSSYYINDGGFYRLNAGDAFTVNVNGANCSGTVSYTTPTTCTTIPPTDSNATPELSSGDLLLTGLLPLGAALLYRRRRARRPERTETTPTRDA